MASSPVSSATCSPTSLQLRLALNCESRRCWGAKPAKQMRGRRVRSFFACLVRERRRTARRCVASGSTAADGLAGWSDSNNRDDRPIQAEGNKWLQGNVGAKIAAAVVLFAGIGFAVHSLSKRSTLVPKQMMESLTTQQEELLAPDKKDDRVEESKSEESNVKIDDSISGAEADVNLEFSSSKSNKSPVAAEPGEGNQTLLAESVQPSAGLVNSINDTSSQEDLQSRSSLDEKPSSSQMTSKKSDLHNSENADCSLSTSLPNLTSEIENSSMNNELADFLDNKNPETEHQEGWPGLTREENSSGTLSVPNSTFHEPSKPFIESISVNPSLSHGFESQIVLEDDKETIGSLSCKEVLLKETPRSSLEVNGVNDSGSSGTSISTSMYSLTNEQDKFAFNETKGGRSDSESLIPGCIFSSSAVPAPSVVSPALQVVPGKVLVPAVIDQVQGQALTALQTLKVIEADVQPSDTCTRREYARWLVAASSALSRNMMSKVYPAMYIENITDLAFDDITPDDPDFSSIQGLAEAGLISSKLSSHDLLSILEGNCGPFLFSPESPLSRQDLVSWKMAMEKRQLPEADKKILYQVSGFRDIDKIHPDAWPMIVADLSSGDQGIISLAFGCTRLFQPDKPVTKAQAALALATGESSDIVSEELTCIEAESVAENAVSAHNALVAEVERDINASFEKELLMVREKTYAVEKMAEEATRELEKLRAEREQDNVALMKEHAAIELEMEVLSKLRREVEEQLESLLSNKVQVSYEKECISKLQEEAELKKQEISRLQHELEIERKALSLARTWAEDEAKRVRQQAKALEEARDRWERHGIKVVVDNDLRDESNAAVTWLTAGRQVDETVIRAENLVDKLKLMADEVIGKSRGVINIIIQKILSLVSVLKEWAWMARREVGSLKNKTILKARESVQEFQQTVAGFSSAAEEKVRRSMKEMEHSATEFSFAVKVGTKRIAGDCRDVVERLTQQFKS